MPPRRIAHVQVPAPRDRELRVAVVADTHSAPHPSTYDLLRERRPDAILHAGDIGAAEVVTALADIAPTHAVRGNIDAIGLPDDLVVELDTVKVLLTHIAVYGPKLRAEVAARARGEDAGVVVCGHSHVPFLGRDKGLVVFNPGSVGPRRFSLPIVFGMIGFGARGMTFEHVSCETGTRWLP